MTVMDVLNDWTSVVTGVTALLGMVLCARSGYLVTVAPGTVRTAPWKWGPEVIDAMMLLSLGLVVMHIAAARLYNDEAAYHLFDINSAWAAAIRLLALFMVTWSADHRFGGG